MIYSFNQTKGRGREDRIWVDFKNKNLALSLLFAKDILSNNGWYIAAMSLSLIDLLKTDFGINNSWIKWPNDIYIDDKKIAGILAETIWKNQKLKKLIIGIGININLTKDDIKSVDKKATSLFLETGRKASNKKFFKSYLFYLSKYFNILLSKNGIIEIKNQWIKNCDIINKKIQWKNFDKILTGRAINIDNQGFLELEIENKIVKAVSGEIKIL